MRYATVLALSILSILFTHPSQASGSFEEDGEGRSLMRAGSVNNEDQLIPATTVPVRTALWDSLKFYSPYIISQVAVTGNGIWNAYLTGRLGGPALQAEAVTLTYEFLIMGTWMGALRATSILAGQLNHGGSGDYDRHKALSNLSKTATLLTIAYGAGAMLMFWQSGNVVKGIGLVSDPAIIKQINDYFWGFMWGVIPTLMLFGDEQFSLGIRDAKTAGFFGTVYAVLASVVAYPLSQGVWDSPNWGVAGIGAGMSVGAACSWWLMRMYYHGCCFGPYEKMNLLDIRTLRPAAFRKYLSYAVPLGLTNSVGLVTNFFSSQFISGFSNNAAAAYSMASSYFTQLEVVMLGYSSAISAKIANFDPRRRTIIEASAADLGNLRRYMFISITSSVGLSVVCAAPALIWKDAFLEFFGGTQSPEVLSLAQRYTWFAAGQAVTNTYSNAVEGVLHGLKDIAVPFVLDICSDGATLLTVAMVAKYAQDPIWLASAGTLVAGVSALAYSFRFGWMISAVAQEAKGFVSSSGSRLKNCWNYCTSWLEGDMSLEEAFQ